MSGREGYDSGMTLSSTPARAGTPPTAKRPESSYKETIESIVMALILAIVFRGFIVEAFVIPTGSMAPTLLGAHMRYHCVNCGYQYDVNYSGRSSGNDVDIPSVAPPVVEDVSRVDAFGVVRRVRQVADKVYGVHCPNCGYQVPRNLPSDPDNDATAPPVYFGDRILVQKYVWLLNGPARWDVVVFKTPDPQMLPLYTVNYIKRLVGLPGDSLMVLDGDVYVGEHNAELKDYKVQRKPRVAQEALWRIVYDNDYLPHPRTDSTFEQPWKQSIGSGWAAGAGADRSTFFYTGSGGASTLAFDPRANPHAHAFTDWLAYDESVSQSMEPNDPSYRADTFDRGFVPRDELAGSRPGRGELTPLNNVSDLRMRLFYLRQSGDGPLRLVMTKLDHTFTLELTPGKASLFHRMGQGEGLGQPLIDAKQVPSLASGRPVEVELANVDYEIRVRIDGKDIFQVEYQPDLPSLLNAYERDELQPMPRVRLEATGQDAAVSHLGLWRDVYYMNRDRSGSTRFHGSPSSPINLGADEFFVMGDNALISGDARYWNKPIDLPAEGLRADSGRVPGRFMLGRAFFVYWPAGHRVGSPRTPGAIPNFGDMRLIR